MSLCDLGSRGAAAGPLTPLGLCSSASSPVGPVVCEQLLPGGREGIRKVTGDVSDITGVFSRAPRGAFPRQVEIIRRAVCQPGHRAM